MFCSECGAKNEKGAMFCSECGFKFEEEKEIKKTTKKVVKEPVSNETKEVSNKKNVNFKTIIVVILILGLAIGYKYMSDITSPSRVANDYVSAVINGDADKIYDFLEIEGDKTFVSKKLFAKAYKESYKNEIENYSILKTEYGKGNLTATVNFNYTTKDSDSEKTGQIKLYKSKEKKLLIFDTWKINELKDSSSLVVKDFKINVLKGSKVVYGGINVTDKYLSKKESTSSVDVYVLPQVFNIKTTIKTTLPNGLEVEKEVVPSTYNNSYTLSFSEKDLTEKQKKAMVKSGKEIINDLYASAINNKKFKDIKSSYERKGLDLDNLEKKYNSFVEDLADNYYKLTKFNVTDMSVYDVYLNSDNELQVEYKVTYDYTVEYKSGDEVKTRDKTSDSAWMTIILGMDKSNYYLINIKTLKTYFY